MKCIAAACLILFTACQTQIGPEKHPKDTVLAAASTPHEPDSTTLGGSWYLQAVLPSDTATGKIPTLILDLGKSKFSGNTGCNSMRGQFWFSAKDSSLSFSDKIISTKMACPGYNEPAFMKSLKNVSHYRLNKGMLTLLSDDNTELSHWMRKPSTPSKTLKA